MKKKLCRVSALALVLVLALSLAFVGTASAAKETVTINVYNWGQYISDGTDGYIDVNKAFTEATGIGVNYMTYDSNETMYTKLKTGGATYDVIIPSDYMIARLIREDMLAELKMFQSHGFWGRRRILWKYGIKKSGFWRNAGMYLFQ